MSHLSYLEAVVVGAFQGVTELFPVSSLGHSVLVPALVGGQWARDLDVSGAGVAVPRVHRRAARRHRRWRCWCSSGATGCGSSPGSSRRCVTAGSQTPVRAAGLADHPGDHPGRRLAGLLLEHTFRTTLGRPMPAAVFLIAQRCASSTPASGYGDAPRRRRRPDDPIDDAANRPDRSGPAD